LSSELVTWGLLIEIVGMISVLVIATINEMISKKTPDRSSSGSGDEPASGRLVWRDATEQSPHGRVTVHLFSTGPRVHC
jgi:hypothetical protein